MQLLGICSLRIRVGSFSIMNDIIVHLRFCIYVCVRIWHLYGSSYSIHVHGFMIIVFLFWIVTFILAYLKFRNIWVMFLHVSFGLWLKYFGVIFGFCVVFCEKYPIFIVRLRAQSYCKIDKVELLFH